MNLTELDRALRQLRLSGMADVLEARLRHAQTERLSPLDLVATLVSDELQRRQDRLFDRRHKQARFRDPDRSLDRFDFDFNKKMNRALLHELATARFVGQREDALFLGPPGTGKSHLAQAIGRAAIQQGERFPDKSHFTVFDCFDGTLLEYFKQATGITADLPAPPTRTIAEIVNDIWSNRDRDFNVRCLVKRLHRVDKEMSGEARVDFAAYVPDGDVARFARTLPSALEADFVETMKLLRDPGLQELLSSYKRPPRVFYVAYNVKDQVHSEWMVREGGVEYKPADYLEAFARFVRENPDHIEAVRILLDRPSEWSPVALNELKQKLQQTRRFRLETLQKAHEVRNKRALVDIISIVKHAADEEQPLLTAAERVERAFRRLAVGHSLSVEQQQWLDRIRIHMIENLSIDREDFDLVPVFTREGGWAAARRVFAEQLDSLIRNLNEAIAA